MVYISGVLSLLRGTLIIGSAMLCSCLRFLLAYVRTFYAVARGRFNGFGKILPTGVGQKCYCGSCICIVPIPVPSQSVNFFTPLPLGHRLPGNAKVTNELCRRYSAIYFVKSG